MTFLAVAVSLALSHPFNSAQGTSPVHPTRLLVKAAKPSVQAAVSRIGGRVLATYPQIGWSTVEVRPGTLEQSRGALATSPGVKAVAYDRAARLAYTPNDPLWPNQWHLRTIKADAAWDTSFGSNQVTVAVIDTGVLRTHEDLAPNMWENTGEIPNNSLDDDGNGYIDDRYGWDFAYNDNSPDDDYGHGTPCAGIVAAVQDNNKGGTGIAPRARIMNLRATNNDGYLFDSYLVPAYLYGADNGARVFSMSYFSDRVSQAEKDAMDYAVSKGVLPIAASGNSSHVLPYYPGAYENVLSVAATDESNGITWFSDWGTWVDVAAPGQGLTTTGKDGGYTGFGGTSGACPHVAGIAALLIGAKPTATASEVRNAIEDTATLLNQPPYGEFSNYGLVNAQAALAAILNGPAPQKPPKVRYVATMGQGPAQSALDPSTSVVARLYGRGFMGVSNLAIKRNGVNAQILAKTRDYVDFRLVYRQAGDVTVWDGASQLATVPNPVVVRTCRPLVEASGSATVTGGFFETVVDDGSVMTCQRDGDSNIVLAGTFRKVTPNTITQLRVRRGYAANGGTEYLQLYDWTTASFPYGSWDTLWQGTASAAPTTTTVAVPNLAKYIDFEGTVYFRLVVIGAAGQANVDSVRLQDSR